MKSYNFCPICSYSMTITVLDGRNVNTCSRKCGFVHWNKPVPVVAALVSWRGEYIVARNSVWPPGLFSLISGFIDTGEHPTAAIQREVNEELGLNLIDCKFVDYYPFKAMNQIIIAYSVKAEGEISITEEIAEIKKMDKESLITYDFGPLKLGRLVVDDALRKCLL